MEYVQTYDQLEVLLLLYRRAGESLSYEGIADEVNLASDIAAVALDTLVQIEVLERAPGSPAQYRYPARSSFEAEVSELSRAYADGRIAIVQLMSQNALERLKKSALLTFAEAFRLRGRKDG